MKIWVDDLRLPPDSTWLWRKTSKETIRTLTNFRIMEALGRTTEPIEIMSLDHDLGGDDTTRPIVLWCCENEFWPKEVVVHSANPVGIDWLEGMIERYKP